MVRLTLLYDTLLSPDFKGGWGFAAWLEVGEQQYLFDTGWNGFHLLHNIKKLNLDLSSLDGVFLSHEHWDHIGGLPNILEEVGGNDVPVWIPQSFSKKLQDDIAVYAKVVPVGDKPLEVAPGLWSTGQLPVPGQYSYLKEQSAILPQPEGSIVVVGCSHPGLDTILDVADQQGSVQAVVGGFHGFEKLDRLEQIPSILGIHCTKRKQEILDRFSQARSLLVGESIVW